MQKISLIIPVYNEEGNISFLLDEIIQTQIFNTINEVILIDDCSTDTSIEKIEQYSKKIDKIILLKHSKNFGQSKCILTAARFTSSEILVTLDADCQNNPNDIKKLLDEYIKYDDVKLVGGIRRKRKDNIFKKVSSRTANFIRRIILKDDCTDTGCSLKVFDRNTFLSLPYFNGIHRFIPALYKYSNSRNIFIDVDHRLRKSGESKYGFNNRFYKGIIDIFRVRKIIKKIRNK